MNYYNNFVIFLKRDHLLSFLRTHKFIENLQQKEETLFDKIDKIVKNCDLFFIKNREAFLFEHNEFPTLSGYSSDGMILIWISDVNYGNLLDRSHDSITEKNMIAKISYRKILRGDKFIMKIDWFELNEEFDADFFVLNNNIMIKHLIKYISKYSEHLNVDEIIFDVDCIFTNYCLLDYISDNKKMKIIDYKNDKNYKKIDRSIQTDSVNIFNGSSFVEYVISDDENYNNGSDISDNEGDFCILNNSQEIK